MNLRGKIPVQYKVQRRQLRVSHFDDHYCSALFESMRTLAVKLSPKCALVFCDDKAKVPVGEPDVAVSIGVRGKLTIAPTHSVLGAADHDLHQKTSLTPSVYMSCNIPDTVDKSFYKRKVTVTVNDSITQQSNPMRHTCALMKVINEMESKPSVVLKYTDGGTDHRCNLEYVKCAAICIFKELDLDFYVAAPCAPGHSWTNPAERVMPVMNIGLQNVALSREKMADDKEKLFRKCTSMDDIRKEIQGKPELKEVWLDSVGPVRQCVENRFRRLALKDEPIKVNDPVREDEVDYLSRHLNFLFPGLDTGKLVKAHTKKVDSYNQWSEKHCRVRNYSFQIRKCSDADCCLPPQNHYDWLPDPMIDENDVNHYKSFEHIYGTNTDEYDRPSFKNQVNAEVSSKKKDKVTDPLVTILPDDPELKGYTGFTAQQARYVISCTECEKPRLIYSKFRLSERQSVQMLTLLSEYDYVCGAPVTVPEGNLHGKIFTRLNIDCSRPLETCFYSSDLDQRKDVCYYCGQSGAEIDEGLKEKFKSVSPVCGECRGRGLKCPCMRPKPFHHGK